MEEVMSSSKTILQTVAATAIFAALAINAAHAANNAHVRAVAKPNGQVQYAQAPRYAARRTAPSQDQWGGWGSWDSSSSQYAQAPRHAARKAAPSQDQWGVSVTFGPSSSSSSASNLDDEVRQIDDINRSLQESLDAINAASQADAAGDAAMEAQMQSDLIRANEPVGPQ
jgi:hypothetical protein